MNTQNELNVLAARDVVRQLRAELREAERTLGEAEQALRVQRAEELARRERAARAEATS